jgi:hypothetical protein
MKSFGRLPMLNDGEYGKRDFAGAKTEAQAAPASQTPGK